MDLTVSKVAVGGSDIGYFSFGRGDVPFVMLPGIFTKSILTLAELVAMAYQQFAQDFRIYVFDRRTDIEPDCTIDSCAEDTAEAMDRLGLKNACVFGVSMGGMIAQSLAVKRPDLVGRLVLGSTASRISPDAARLLDSISELAGRNDTAALYEAFAKAVYTPSFYEKYQKAIMLSMQGSTDEDIRRFVLLTEAIKKFDIYGELDKVKCPLLVIGAGEDGILGVQASRDIAEKTGAELYIYEGYGHAAYDEAEDYKDRLFEFFTRQV